MVDLQIQNITIWLLLPYILAYIVYRKRPFIGSIFFLISTFISTYYIYVDYPIISLGLIAIGLVLLFMNLFSNK